MVQAQRFETGGTPYINPKTVVERAIKRVKFENEFQLVDSEYEGNKTQKYAGLISTEALGFDKGQWEMNHTTSNWLIANKDFGPETKNWIGKWLDIAVKKAGSASPAIYPKDCSLEQVMS